MNLYPSAKDNYLMKKIRAIDLKTDFPALARELEGDFKEYNTRVPNVADHLQRCKCEDEALEIINFFERRREISFEYARALRYQLVTKGLKSFGMRNAGDYESQGMIE